MPTAAKLVAAFLLAAVGWLASQTIRPLFPEGTDFGIFNEVNTVIGFLCGWIVIGSRSGRGYAAAVSNGLTGGVALVFWGLFIQAANEMVDRSFRRFYDSPFEALGAVVEIGMEFGQKMLVTDVLTVLAAGSLIAGLLAEAAAQRWR